MNLRQALTVDVLVRAGHGAPHPNFARWHPETQREFMRGVLGDRDTTCSRAAQPGNVPGKYEVDGINDAAFARTIRADDHERFAIHLQFQFAEAPELLDAEPLELDHSADSPAAWA